jgi:DNA-binding NtrC family response regulator
MKTILIVDDQRDLRFVMQAILKRPLKKVAEIEEADSVRDAKRRLARGGIDLVVSDVNLGDGQGPEIKKAYPKVPFLYVTGDTDWKSPDGSPVLSKMDFHGKLPKAVMELLSEAVQKIVGKVAGHHISVDGAVAHLLEVSPPGFSGTTKAMKKHKEIDNPYALSWWMYNKGDKSHKKPEPDTKGIKNYIPPEEYEKSKKGKVTKFPSRKKRLAASLEDE